MKRPASSFQLTSCWHVPSRSGGLVPLPLARKAVEESYVAERWRRSTHRCGELRAAEDLRHPYRWPIAAQNANNFRWRVKLAYRLEGEQINMLELRALLAAVRLWARRGGHRRRSCLHLVDYQVCLSALAKGRSSSRSASTFARCAVGCRHFYAAWVRGKCPQPR